MAAEHVIKSVRPGSIAEEMGIESGDVLLSVGGQQIEDIFDYQYLIQEEYIEAAVRKAGGEEWLLEIDKEYSEDLGIEFENGLMDEYRSCRNKCIFCFIDQMPEGMRETLYFKDDDSRLSFLQGNYVTLTNMSDHDIERIIRYHLSPINISVQTMNPELRCTMLHNRFAGEALQKLDRLYEGGIRMNGQIVLCKGVNDGAELEYSIRSLTKYLPQMESVSVVPVGLSKYREGLYPLEPFTKEDAGEVLRLIHGWQERIYEEHGTHFIHASDEWYILAEEELPQEERYDGYLQLENGVGMVRLLLTEFEEAFAWLSEEASRGGCRLTGKVKLSMATGKLAFPYIRQMADRMEQLFMGLTIQVFAIRNDFFGEMITVSGLLTGADIMAQLNGQDLGSVLLLPQNVLRSGEDVFLDDVTRQQMESALQVPVDIVKSSGQDFVDAIVKWIKR
jgi:putative radical SAM enzyme (TIGR03279 family)